MEVTLNIPLSLSERLPMGPEIRVPATWEEFLAILPKCSYRIEYDNHQIISFMGYASEAHEKLVLIIANLLQGILNEDEFECFGSNLALHTPGPGKRYFNADCTVVKGRSHRVPLSDNMYAVANPILLVEVLSPSTEDYDLGNKFTHYRKIPSLQQVIFIDSTKMNIISQTRLPNSDNWLLQEYMQPGNAFKVLNQGEITLESIYKKIVFEK